MILGNILNLKHLTGLTYAILVIIVLFYLLHKYKWQEKNVYIGLFIAFYTLEVIKIGSMILDGGGFPMNHLPLHLCSLPLYLIPILAFCKNEKVITFVKPAAFATILFGGVIALLYPVNIIGSDSWLPLTENYIPFVSFNYHALMVFLPLYLLKTRTYDISWVKLKEAYLVSLAFMALAIIVNAILDKDFMLLNTGNGSPIVFIRDTSQILYTFSMIILGLFAIFVFHSIGMVLKKKI